MAPTPRLLPVTSVPAVRSAMAGESGGKRRSGAETPGARRGSGATCAPLPPPQDPKALAERPLTLRRSPRLHLQKENVPVPPVSPPTSPTSPPSPPPPSVAPRVRRSYSRLEPLGTPRPLGGSPLSPIVPPPPPRSAPLPPPGPLPPERKKKKKLPPIDVGQLELWAAAMNQQFEEAERFRLVVE